MKFVFFFIFLPFLILSCRELYDTSGIETHRFWAQDFSSWPYRHYRVNAQLLWEGKYCNVWVERGSGVGRMQAQLVGNEYDNKIRNQLIDAFSIKNFTTVHTEDRIFSDVMEYADSLGNNDGKLCILLLDIRDNYEEGVNESYVGGYFWSGDFGVSINSNRRDMIYIDTNPGMRGNRILDALDTLAHEMQHLMNHVTGIAINRPFMDVWVNEGLSSAAEWIYSGHSLNRISWFNNNGVNNSTQEIKGLIDIGNNFFVWGNRLEESKYALLDDYATVYLFFQYLRLQSGGFGIYRDIISSIYNDHRAVTSVMNTAVPGFNYSNWDVLLKNWLAANYINAPSGEFGYMNDPVLRNVRTPVPPVIAETIKLAPGEGVYSATVSFGVTPSQGININYAGLSLAGSLVSNSHVFPGGAMLTFNVNTNWRNETPEEGITTGIPITPSANVNHTGRTIMYEAATPLRIGASGLLK